MGGIQSGHQKVFFFRGFFQCDFSLVFALVLPARAAQLLELEQRTASKVASAQAAQQAQEARITDLQRQLAHAL